LDQIQAWVMSVKEMMDGPLPLAVAMAADDQDLGVVPINRVADHAPGVPLNRFVADVDHLRPPMELEIIS